VRSFKFCRTVQRENPAQERSAASPGRAADPSHRGGNDATSEAIIDCSGHHRRARLSNEASTGPQRTARIAVNRRSLDRADSGKRQPRLKDRPAAHHAARPIITTSWRRPQDGPKQGPVYATTTGRRAIELGFRARGVQAGQCRADCRPGLRCSASLVLTAREASQQQFGNAEAAIKQHRRADTDLADGPRSGSTRKEENNAR